MPINKIILRVPPTSNGYCHLNQLNLYGANGAKLDKVVNTSDATFTLTTGRKITITPSGAYYPGYPLIGMFSEETPYWCSPKTGNTETLTLSFSEPIATSNIAGMSFRGDGGNASYRGTLAVEAYHDSKLIFSNSITLPDTSSGNVVSHTFTGAPIDIVKRDGKYYYRKAPPAPPVYQIVPVSLNNSDGYMFDNPQFFDENGRQMTITDAAALDDKTVTFKLDGIDATATMLSEQYSGYPLIYAFDNLQNKRVQTKNESQRLGTMDSGVRFNFDADPDIRKMTFYTEVAYRMTDFKIYKGNKEVYHDNSAQSSSPSKSAEW